VGCNGLDKACNDANGFGYGVGGFRGSRVIGSGSDHGGGDEGGGGGGDDSAAGRKVKFLCSFGGKILPRPSDGMLRYVGGQTRIISVRKDVSFNDLVQKMVDTYGHAVVIKYQLPEEDLDALVSVSCHDDVENMMEEYDKLVERSPDGSAKLRVFLFSASESEVSSGMQLGDLQDTGQKYFDAVNGIGMTEATGFGGGINRKGSVTSAASTQNSDLSGAETFDSSIIGQGDVTGVPLSSPKENVAVASSDSSANMVISEASAPVYSGVSAVSIAMPVARASPYFQNEVELERSVPAALPQQPFGLQQGGIEVPAPSPYLQPCVDPSQEVMNHQDCVQVTSQMRFTNPQLVGKTGPVFRQQQQFSDNTPGLAFHHQVIPGVQMPVAQQSSHAGVRPNVIQPQQLVQPQQHLLDQYHDENTSGVRIIQLPAERSYNAYQVPVGQVPPVIVGGNYGWVQVPSQERVVISDGLLPQQQVTSPEKFRRTEECSMCQTKLPHAHSDPVVQDERSGGAGPVPDSTPSHYSFPMEDNIKAQAPNRIMQVVMAPLKEGIAEQGAGTRPRVVGKQEPPDGVHQTETTGLSHNIDPQPEEFDHPGNSCFQEKIALEGRKQSPNDELMATAALSYLDDVGDQHMIPVENWVKQDVLINKPVNSDMSIVDGTSIRTSECMIQGSPNEYTDERTRVISKSDEIDNWIRQDHLKPIDGKMDTFKIHNSDAYVSNDYSFLPADKPSGNDNLGYNTQKSVEEEVILDNNFGRSKLIVDANQNKMAGVLPCSSVETSYRQNSRSGEHNEATQPPFWGIPGSNPQPNIGNPHTHDPALSTSSPSVRFGDVQDTPNSLFSNQDPWNIQHGTFFPPARPSKAALKKETYSCQDPFREDPGNFGEQAQLDDSLYQSFKQNLTLEHGRSAKGP